MFVFVVMIDEEAVIFANFMTPFLPLFQAQSEIISHISISRLKLSQYRDQGERTHLSCGHRNIYL